MSGGPFHYSFLTSAIPPEALSDDRVLAASPLIYQPRVPKAYELRLTYIGNTLLAARLDSQAHAESSLDWRRASKAKAPIVRTEVPRGVDAACRHIMATLGLRYGAFDLIVQPGGDAVFLEVNEAGQCFWLELANPELPMLDVLLEFFQSRDPEHVYSQRQPRYRLRDFMVLRWDGRPTGPVGSVTMRCLTMLPPAFVSTPKPARALSSRHGELLQLRSSRDSLAPACRSFGCFLFHAPSSGLDTKWAAPCVTSEYTATALRGSM